VAARADIEANAYAVGRVVAVVIEVNAADTALDLPINETVLREQADRTDVDARRAVEGQAGRVETDRHGEHVG
jgi:hypothetical protein